VGAATCRKGRRLAVGAVVFVGMAVVVAGCAFDGVIAVQFRGVGPVEVSESSTPTQMPHRVAGVTKRKGEVVRIDCSITVVYDIREATGSAVLAQTYVVHLRTRRLARGTAYDFDCMGPLVVELPADASAIQATSAGSAGAAGVPLPVHARVMSIPLSFRRSLRPEPRTQLAIVKWPRTLAAGDYRVELSFSLPEARAFREKALDTAAITCGRSRYLQPILPAVTGMARAPAFTIDPRASPLTLSLPHVAGAIGSYAQAKKTLSCAS